MDLLSFCLDISIAAVQYLFLLHLMDARATVRSAVLYGLLWGLCALTARMFSFAGITALLQILLMYAAARAILHVSNVRSWLDALLIICITELSVGTISSLQFLMLPPFFGEPAFETGRIFTAVAAVLLTAGACWAAGRLLPSSAIQRQQAVLLLIPLLFFCCAEIFLLQTVYAEAPGFFSPALLHIHLGIFLLQLLGFASLFWIWWAWRQAQNAWESQVAMEVLTQAAQAQRKYVTEIRHRYDQTKSVRHDFRNHLLALDGLLGAGRPEEARAYLAKIDASVQTAILSLYTGNPVVDVLLSEKFRQAQEAGITTAIEGTLPPGPEDFDLCVLFANALDNAIHACVDVSGDKSICVACTRQGDFLLIRIKNSCLPGAVETIGTGLRNMQTVAEKYHGTLRTRCVGATYLLEVLLHISARPDDSSEHFC